MAGLTMSSKVASLLPSSRRRGMLAGMAKPLAKLLSMLTPKRRWAQFSLATMLAVVTVLCVWLSVVVNRAHRQRDAVAAIVALGGKVVYEQPDTANEALPRRFLRRWLPRDYFDEVGWVNLDGIQIPGAGLAHLQGLTSLRRLDLGGALVTDAGLAHLQGLTALQRLSLHNTRVGDAGLAHLQGLTALKLLGLNNTQVNDAGLAHLKGLLGLRKLYLFSTRVTDAGLAHLKGLTALEVLLLDGTQVTDVGVAQLRKTLPNCNISGP